MRKETKPALVLKLQTIRQLSMYDLTAVIGGGRKGSDESDSGGVKNCTLLAGLDPASCK